MLNDESYSFKKPQIKFLSVELQTLTKFKRELKLISLSYLGEFFPCMCQIGLLYFSNPSSCLNFLKCEKYSSILFGITSKNNLFADFGF